MKTHKTYHPHLERDGESYAVEIRTAVGTIRVPCWTAEEAGDIRDSVLDAGLTARVIGLPCTVAYCGAFADEDDVAGLPVLED